MSSRTPNNTNFSAPNDIAQLNTTDYRPNKSLYENIVNNNDFRLYMQRNANKIRKMQIDEFERKMAACDCEKQHEKIIPYKPGYTCKK